jgi:hypothetical protein
MLIVKITYIICLIILEELVRDQCKGKSSHNIIKIISMVGRVCDQLTEVRKGSLDLYYVTLPPPQPYFLLLI